MFQIGVVPHTKADRIRQPVVIGPDRFFSRIDVVVQSRHDHHGKFQPLGFVDAQQANRSTGGLGMMVFFDKGPFRLVRGSSTQRTS